MTFCTVTSSSIFITWFPSLIRSMAILISSFFIPRSLFTTIPDLFNSLSYSHHAFIMKFNVYTILRQPWQCCLFHFPHYTLVQSAIFIGILSFSFHRSVNRIIPPYSFFFFDLQVSHDNVVIDVFISCNCVLCRWYRFWLF